MQTSSLQGHRLVLDAKAQGPVPKANLGAHLSFHIGLDDSRTRDARNAACRGVGALTAQACEWDNWQRVEGLGLCVFFSAFCALFFIGWGLTCVGRNVVGVEVRVRPRENMNTTFWIFGSKGLEEEVLGCRNFGTRFR